MKVTYFLLGLLVCLVPFAQAKDPVLQASYRNIYAKAVKVAGAPGDIPNRVKALLTIYKDSQGNHAFPLIAAHGAKWGNKYFKITGPIGEAISYRYFYDPAERQKRLKMLDTFAEEFKAANRQVFIDTYTNYYFTKLHGDKTGAKEFIQPKLLKQLMLMHKARKNGTPLYADEKKVVFKTSLLFEQEMSVGPRVDAAVKKFDCPILKTLVLKPIVHFSYFPNLTFFPFDDFSDKAERIKYALKAYDLAEEAGWDEVQRLIQ